MYGVLDHHLENEQLRSDLRYVIGVCGRARTHVAREIGMADRALRDFLRGAEASPKNLRLMWGWHLVVDVPSVAFPEQAALSLLVSAFPLDQRGVARELLVRRYRAAAIRCGVPVPRWVAHEMAWWKHLGRYRPRGRRVPLPSG